MIANESVVYEHDIAEDAEVSNRYGLLDLDLSELLDGDDDSTNQDSYDLDGIQ